MTSSTSSPTEGLLDSEFFWRDNYTWLKDQGYELRPRYAPDWVPSWQGTGRTGLYCEDGHSLIYAQVNDALHIPTGSRVALKRLNTDDHPFEEDIMRYLCSDSLSKDSRNHCAPLLEVLHPPRKDGAKDIRILVMPYLRLFYSPNFDTFGEAIECIRQLLEGLQFMHENRVAHLDLKYDNFMMTPEEMFPDGYHPLRIHLKPDLTGPAKFYTRTQRPAKYFIIDFGHSRRYDASNTSPLEPTFRIGTEKVETELQNPFVTDIYYLGNILRQVFLEGHPFLTTMRGYKGFEFLKPLIDDMTQTDPTKRPNIDAVVKSFEDVVNGLGTSKLRSRTSSRRANAFQDSGHLLSHWRRRIVFMIKRTPALPRRQSSDS